MLMEVEKQTVQEERATWCLLKHTNKHRGVKTFSIGDVLLMQYHIKHI